MNNNRIQHAIDTISSKSRGVVSPPEHALTINFHPDRLTSSGKPLLIAIAEDGRLKSQFETHTSNGGLTAYPGGERWTWEQRIFDGAYDETANDLRPKYGALNYRDYPMGASPRFGSCYFQLKAHMFDRTTFCFPDSFFEPNDFATATRLKALITKASASEHDQLDDYIEAHIHGKVSISEDVECLVLDPSYRDTEIETHALKLNLPIKWHQGFQLSLTTMQRFADYRGRKFVQLAEKLAENGSLNPRLLGLAVTELNYDQQDIKKVWHYLARFGYANTTCQK
ncbi:hypothetical protein VISI1226_06728 [Vibrio sinaloensis DSM 21326]|uniref:DUF3626 domain-containing protein n=1 Tax=Vibrio sinaloensis DSM 21326 TaxID=945550 RepID=E8MA30_PHOS4|nr:DUF3626 domain-containing protein [Vibrio sinaloensis]EGA68979.1 hypothetical protein VISI1226_06728 [Vibrio sinaloensis DSM 21326]